MKGLNIAPFYQGQKLVYIGKSNGRNWMHEDGSDASGPSTNEKVTCSRCFLEKGEWAICLVGYGNRDEDCFYIHDEEGNVVFKPLQEQKFPSLTFKEVVEKEKELISLN